MRAVGVFALALGYLVVGTFVLVGIGFVRSRAATLRSAGLALVTGWAATGILLTLALELGAPASVLVVGMLWLLLALSSIAFARFVPERREPERAVQRRLDRGVVCAFSAALVVIGGLLLARGIFSQGIFIADAWSFWIPKAKAIYFFGGLDSGPGGFTSFASPDYPPLKPALDAAVFSFAGTADPLLLPAHGAIVAVAFLGALVAVARRLTGLSVATASAAFVGALPGFFAVVSSTLGEEPLAIEFALGVALVAVGLVLREPRPLVLASLFLAAATLTKNEGAMLALAVALGASAAASGRRLRVLATLAVPSVVLFLSWKAWLLANAIPPNYAYHFTALGSPSYLASHFGQLTYGGRKLGSAAFSASQWSLVIPLALGTSLLLARRRRAFAAFVASVSILPLVGYAVVYWISIDRIFAIDARHSFVDDNVWRLMTPVSLGIAALLPIALWLVGRGAAEPGPEPSPADGAASASASA